MTTKHIIAVNYRKTVKRSHKAQLRAHNQAINPGTINSQTRLIRETIDSMDLINTPDTLETMAYDLTPKRIKTRYNGRTSVKRTISHVTIESSAVAKSMALIFALFVLPVILLAIAIGII